MNLLDAPILQILEAYRAALLAKDVAAFASLYDADVCVFDLWGTWSYRGIAAWRGMATEWFGSLGTERVAAEFTEVQTTVAQDLALVHAFVTYRGLSAEGQALRAMHNRLTWALRRVDGAWKIVHEHTSAPADFASAKLMLQRTA